MPYGICMGLACRLLLTIGEKLGDLKKHLSEMVLEVR